MDRFLALATARSRVNRNRCWVQTLESAPHGEAKMEFEAEAIAGSGVAAAGRDEKESPVR